MITPEDLQAKYQRIQTLIERMDAQSKCRDKPLTNRSGKVVKPATVQCGTVCRQKQNCKVTKGELRKVRSALKGRTKQEIAMAVKALIESKKAGQSSTRATYGATSEAREKKNVERREKRFRRSVEQSEKRAKGKAKPGDGTGKKPKESDLFAEFDQDLIAEVREKTRPISDTEINEGMELYSLKTKKGYHVISADKNRYILQEKSGDMINYADPVAYKKGAESPPRIPDLVTGRGQHVWGKNKIDAIEGLDRGKQSLMAKMKQAEADGDEKSVRQYQKDISDIEKTTEVHKGELANVLAEIVVQKKRQAEADKKKEDDAKEIAALKEKAAKAAENLPEGVRPKSEWEGIDEPIVLSQLDSLQNRIRSGETSAAEIQHHYDRFLRSQDNLRGELQKMTLAELKDLAPYARGKKEVFVKMVLGELEARFIPPSVGGVSYQLMVPGAKEEAYKKAVASWTDEGIQADAADFRNRLAQHKKAVENPETLDEFKVFLRRKTVEDMTPQQREQYEKAKEADNQARILETRKLEDEAAKQSREARERKPTPTPSTSSSTGSSSGQPKVLVGTHTHTKTGAVMHVAKMSDRVSKEEYQEIRARATALGGQWNRFTKGFSFPNEDAAKKFAEGEEQIRGGAEPDPGNPSPTPTPAPTPTVSYKAAIANKLRQKAETARDKANEIINQDRQTNTSKRATEAAHIIAKNEKVVALTETMDRVADAIEAGQTTYLDKLEHKTHFEELESILASAHYKSTRESKNQNRDRDAPPDEVSVDHAEYPSAYLHRDTVFEFIEQVGRKQGASRTAKRMAITARAVIDDAARNNGRPILSSVEGMKDLEALYDIAKKDGKIDIPWQIDDEIKAIKRLRSMGITNGTELRAALREYLNFRQAPREEDPVKKIERAMVGAKVGVDYFPTPKALAAELADELDVRPGMKVLEPSAGSGYLAQAMKDAAGGDIDLTTVEMSHTLGELLRAKKFNPVQQDFLQFNQGKGEYDRILMNPPFSKGADIDHVRHAYDLLAPGGQMIAIMSEGPFFRGQKKDQEFRDWLEEKGGVSEKLPEGTFKASDVQTGVNSRKVVLTKPGTKAKTDRTDSVRVTYFGLNPNPFYKPFWN